MIICVIGPTGVGKTKLSVELAKRYDGVIINADAMQVYKKMNIGTAKIKEEEKKGVPHFLFDIVEPDYNYSVYDYQKDLRELLDRFQDKNIILVGGTGLYIKAGLFNYEFSEITPNNYDEYSNEELYALLEKKGNTEGVHVNNRRRLISRLNSSGNNNLKNELLYDNVFFIGLSAPRDVLYKRIDERVEEMFLDGLVSEVKTLYSEYGLTKALKTGIGYKEVIAYLDGLMSLDEAKNLIKKKSRQYAKRQYTWFNNQMDVEWFNVCFENFDRTILEVENYINSKNI